MVQQDVLSPLSKLLQDYREPWTPAQKDQDTLQTGRKDPQTEVFIQATHLLWNLWWVIYLKVFIILSKS